MENDIWTTIMILAFWLMGIHAVIGHLVFYSMVRRRGVPVQRILQNVPFYAEYRYFRHQPSVRSKTLDMMAITVALSLLGVLILAAVLFPEMLTTMPAPPSY